LFETSLAEHSDRNDGAASTKERDERDCPDGIAEQCRSDPHAHCHDEYDRGRNDGHQGDEYAISLPFLHGAGSLLALGCALRFKSSTAILALRQAVTNISEYRLTELSGGHFA
jgi:hypothetical protein